MQEWWKRRPAIDVVVAGADGDPPRLNAAALAPWPIDIDAMVRAALEEAGAMGAAGAEARGSPLSRSSAHASVVLHPGRSEPVATALEIELPDEGAHELHWTVYTRSDERPRSGVVELAGRRVRSDRSFRRLPGLLAYPDVDILDGDGVVLHPARVTDPPTRPAPLPPDTDELGAKLRHRRADLDWQQLGLDDDET